LKINARQKTNRKTEERVTHWFDVFSGGRTRWHVFYHFVGAVPGSTELFAMLKRLLLEMSVVSVS